MDIGNLPNRKKSIAKQNQDIQNTKKLNAIDGPNMSDIASTSYSDDPNPSRKKKKSIAKQDQDNENQQEGINEVEQTLYDAASNGNSSKLNQILEKWKCRISSEDLENSVLKIYTKLKLNNIALVDEVELSLYEFFSKRCFFPKHSVTSYKISDIKNHLSMLANVVDMVSLFADEQEIFIFSLKYIAKEIHVLKHLLRSTYDKLSWEEIEFYLVCYIISATQQHELNVFYTAILKKSNLIRYLKIFSLSLRKLHLEEMSKLSKFPELSRIDVVRKITKNNPDLKAMYNDYHFIRDVHSLYKIAKYAKFVQSTHPQEKGANHVIIRALCVISLHLKNTLASPKLSQITADFVLLSISENSRTPILGLMNACTYREAYRYRTELLEHCNEEYLQIFRNDVEHIGIIAEDLLFRHCIRLFRQQYSQIVEGKTGEENIPPLFLYVHKELQRLSEQNLIRQDDKVLDNLRYLRSELSENDPRRLHMENIIESMIKPETREFELQPMLLYTLKPEAQNMFLQYVIPKLSTNDVEKLLNLVFSILEDNAKKNSYRYEIGQHCAETINLLRFEGDDNTLSENFNEIPTAHQEFIDRTRRDTCSKIYQDHLSETLRTLTNILEKSHYKKFKTDNKYFEILKSLVVDVIHDVNIISGDEEMRNDPNFSSIWIDYLESDHDLNDLIFNSIVAVFHIANKFIQEDPKNLILNTSNETKTSKEKTSFFEAFLIILKKRKQFTELAKGNIATFQLFLDEGADIRARDAEKSTYLHIAVKMCDISLVENLCDLGLSLNSKNIGFHTPLHIAAKMGSDEILAYIAKKTRSVLHDIDDFGRTALHIAVLNEHEKTVQILIDSGSDTSAEDHLGFTPLLYAVMSRNEEITKLLLYDESKPHKVSSERNNLQNLFQNAIKQNWFEIVIFLLSKHFVTLDSENGAAAMLSAVSNGRREILEILLQHGGYPINAIDGKTALHIAVLNEHYQKIRDLTDAGSDPFVKDDLGQSSLGYALSTGNKEIIILLLTHNTDLNDSQQMELQHVFLIAIKQNYVEIVEFLLSRCFVNLHVRTQTDALCFAVSNGQLEILEILLQHGVDPDNSLDGCPPIVIAAQKNLDLLVEKLVLWKANVNASDSKNGMTALHHAAKNGNDFIIDCLFGRPTININCLDVEKQTPLHLAVENSHLSTVEILLGRTGIEVDALNSKRDTPLLIAIGKGYLNIVRLLIEKWAVLNNKEYPVSPLDLAKVNGHEKMVQLLANNGATCSKSSKSSFAKNETNRTQNNSPSIMLTTKNLDNPTIIIRGVDPDYYKCNNDEIVNSIIEQNHLERSIKYKFHIIKKNLRDSCSIIIVLDKTIYKEILDKKYLNIGWESCPVSDYSYIYRCYRCAGFNHIHNECKNEEMCGRCSKKHNMEGCESTDLQCINCMRQNKKLGLHLDIRHSAFDQFCPYYRKLLNDKYKKQMKYSKLNC